MKRKPISFIAVSDNVVNNIEDFATGGSNWIPDNVVSAHRLSKRLTMNHGQKETLRRFISHLLCLLHFHDFKVTERTFEFGSGGVETVKCRRCELIVKRSVN